MRPKQAPQPLTGSLLSQNYTQSDDTLRVLLYAHSSDYFMFRSTPIGFQYELLNALAKGLDMKLDLTGFDFNTKTGAKMTITWGVEEPVPADPVQSQ